MTKTNVIDGIFTIVVDSKMHPSPDGMIRITVDFSHHADVRELVRAATVVVKHRLVVQHDHLNRPDCDLENLKAALKPFEEGR